MVKESKNRNRESGDVRELPNEIPKQNLQILRLGFVCVQMGARLKGHCLRNVTYRVVRLLSVHAPLVEERTRLLSISMILAESASLYF
jgi:hypothetical protein